MQLQVQKEEKEAKILQKQLRARRARNPKVSENNWAEND